MVQKIPDCMGPCGVYCAACPSYKISCHGCGSEDKNQKRISKWNCNIRICCFEKKNINFCYECTQFPCKEYRKKLSESHKENKKFRYRHELPNNLEEIKRIGIMNWIKEQEIKWKCPKCLGTITFYHYSCKKCGYKKQIE